MIRQYTVNKEVQTEPRLPLRGVIDPTFRCNNNCLHCWIRIPPDSKEKAMELSFEEIKRIVTEAKNMGCRHWVISGGEPMFRKDFVDIFDYITHNSMSYSLNTNGTLITPKIAKLMRQRGRKLISVYGATADVHDHITRTPGSFEAMLRGFAYLKEAGAKFSVRLVSMHDNFHQLNDMIDLAKSVSGHRYVGSEWLYLSAAGTQKKNQEIIKQRLLPQELIELNRPALFSEKFCDGDQKYPCGADPGNKYLFSSCISARRNFYIDPYGRMTFCLFIKAPHLLYDLKKGNFRQCWEEFIPSLADKVKASQKYYKECGRCLSRRDCYWCPVYGYLENRDFNAKVKYLCRVAKENLKFQRAWRVNNRRYYKIADMTIQLDADMPIKDNTFLPVFKKFETRKPGRDILYIQHHFCLPPIERDLGRGLYKRPPWAIYQKDNAWIYLRMNFMKIPEGIEVAAVFNNSYTKAVIYSADAKRFLKGNVSSLTLLTTDQVILAQTLAARSGFYIHACGVKLNKKGLLFVGNSGAGKSTVACMLKKSAEILCDDRIIVRKKQSGFRIYGTWCHGTVPEVSNNSAYLRTVFFIHKAKEDRIEPIKDKKGVAKMFLACLIKPLGTALWWNKVIPLIDNMIATVPCYTLHFRKESDILSIIKKYARI
jgi:MoaA/NifB/PqqE/SkfB family radical SAM enzyme